MTSSNLTNEETLRCYIIRDELSAFFHLKNHPNEIPKHNAIHVNIWLSCGHKATYEKIERGTKTWRLICKTNGGCGGERTISSLRDDYYYKCDRGCHKQYCNKCVALKMSETHEKNDPKNPSRPITKLSRMYDCNLDNFTFEDIKDDKEEKQVKENIQENKESKESNFKLSITQFNNSMDLDENNKLNVNIRSNTPSHDSEITETDDSMRDVRSPNISRSPSTTISIDTRLSPPPTVSPPNPNSNRLLQPPIVTSTAVIIRQPRPMEPVREPMAVSPNITPRRRDRRSPDVAYVLEDTRDDLNDNEDKTGETQATDEN